jgi:mannose-6-phosphate isomerase-like protein (cupin superfamily)
MTPATRTRLADLDKLPFPPGRLSKQAFDTGDIELRLYAPRGKDEQVPHDRDELYVVMAGTGRFKRGSETVPFGPGDVLFAAAHEEHRFLDFSADLQLWVLFYGPKKPA